MKRLDANTSRLLTELQIDNMCAALNADYKWSTVVDSKGKATRKLTFTLND